MAVIVILAIIALIAVPIILNIIEDTKDSANKRSIEMYGDSITNAVADYMLLSNGIIPEWDDIKDNIDKYYKGNKVECDITQINSDGAVYLSECKVNGKYVDYIYGKGETSGCTVIKGDGTKLSDEIKCSGEEFYVLENDGTNIKMLAKYNLNVGDNPYPGGKIGIQNKNTNGNAPAIMDIEKYSEIATSGQDPTEEDLVGLIDYNLDRPIYGAVQFGDISHLGEINKDTFLYDEKSNLYPYIESYKEYLIKNGISSTEATIPPTELISILDSGEVQPTEQEIKMMGSIMNYGFWLGSVFEGEIIGFSQIMSLSIAASIGKIPDENFEEVLLSIYNKGFGVRPLITISTDELNGPKEATDAACFDYIENVDNVTGYTINHDACMYSLNNYLFFQGISSEDKEKLCGGETTEKYGTLVDLFNSSVGTIEEMAQLGIINLTGTPNGTLSITGYKCGGEKTNDEANPYTKGEVMDVVIPSEIGGKKVTTIASMSFFGNKSIMVENVGKPIIESVTVPNTVTSIGGFAFRANQLKNVTIGKNVTIIGNSAFSSNQLTNVIIPDSVENIGYGAFERNQLTSLTIGKNVKIIDDSAFHLNQLTSIIIPDSVESIGDSAFYENQIISLTLGKNIKTIDGTAFADHKLTSVVIPSSIESIGNSAFSGRSTITNVKINAPKSQVTLGSSVFSWAEGYSDANIEWAS